MSTHRRVIFALLCSIIAFALSGCAGGPRAMDFVFVKGGCYKMGNAIDTARADERPAHEVCISDYYIGKYEVTQGQWQQVMKDNPSFHKECGPECPVEFVSYNDVQEFIKILNASSGGKYRLPTEAEWEYAARSGGNDDVWPGTNDEASLPEFAWYNKNSDFITHRVGLKKSNGLGIHDMSGNVLEWCMDWYGASYYTESPKDNPRGPSVGQKRVMRGGRVNDYKIRKRDKDWPDIRDSFNGFRLVRSAK